jgi:hypothetical protein
MSDLSTNPGHTPCGRGFLQREDAGGSLSPGCRADSQAAPNAIARPSSTVSISCRAQKLVMRQPGKCGVTRQAQVPRRSFGILAEGGALPSRMELPGPTSGAGASDSALKGVACGRAGVCGGPQL